MILLVDGDNLLYRAFWISKNNPLINSTGLEVSTIYNCLRMIKSYAEKYKATEIYVAWDRKLTWPSTNFRKEAIQTRQIQSKASGNLTYKGNRNPEDAKMVHEQQAYLIAALQFLNVKNIFPNVMEADDVISWLSTTLQGPKAIISSDKDLLQLVNVETLVFNAVTKQECTLDTFEQFTKGIPQNLYLNYRALVGDPSDNIKGVYGIGPKKALKLLGMENWRDQLDKDQETIVNTNLHLMNLKTGYLVHEGEVEIYQSQLNKLQTNLYNLTEFEHLCNELEFPSITEDLDTWSRVFSGKPLANGKMLKVVKE